MKAGYLSTFKSLAITVKVSKEPLSTSSSHAQTPSEPCGIDYLPGKLIDDGCLHYVYKKETLFTFC